jgi:hypothetical protein
MQKAFDYTVCGGKEFRIDGHNWQQIQHDGGRGYGDLYRATPGCIKDYFLIKQVVKS